MPIATERQGFQQVAVLVVDGFGVGAQRDVGPTEAGAHTLQHTSTYMGGLELPFFQWMGLGNAAPVRGLPRADPPAASVGLLQRRSPGSDRDGALRELFGSTLASLVSEGLPVDALGWIAGALGEGETTSREPGLGREALLRRMTGILGQKGRGIVVAGFSTGAEQGGPVAVARSLQWLDAQVPVLLDVVDEATLFVCIGLGGSDPVLPPGKVPGRELTPLLAYTPAVPSGVDLGTRRSLTDVAATLAENFGGRAPAGSESFFAPLLS